jgi:hypothetical protein
MLIDGKCQLRVFAVKSNWMNVDRRIVLVLGSQPFCLLGIHLKQMELRNGPQISPGRMETVTGAAVYDDAVYFRGICHAAYGCPSEAHRSNTVVLSAWQGGTIKDDFTIAIR